MNNSAQNPSKKPISLFFSLLAGITLCCSLSVLTACEDDPILEPTDNSTTGGSYGKFEEPDSLHLLQDLPNPATF